MIMSYLRIVTTFNVLTRKTIFTNIYKVGNRHLGGGILAVEYKNYDNEYEIEPLLFEETVCPYCRGTKYTRCNLCKSGCVSCKFTQVMPCPFCNSNNSNNFNFNNIKDNNQKRKKYQYRVPF